MAKNGFRELTNNEKALMKNFVLNYGDYDFNVDDTVNSFWEENRMCLNVE